MKRKMFEFFTELANEDTPVGDFAKDTLRIPDVFNHQKESEVWSIINFQSGYNFEEILTEIKNRYKEYKKNK